jgi:tetratricopeptide (TPR) repeat protein
LTRLFRPNREHYLHVCLLIVSICIVYFKVLYAPFSTWDDGDYVFKNPDIQGLSFEHLRLWFTKFYVGTYQPLTMLSYAIDFFFGKLDPFSYHLTNIFFHIFNVIILYCLVLKIQKDTVVAFFVSLLFALNPVQSETVSWIAERKTLLCAFFYLLALLQYAGYVSDRSSIKLLAVVLLGLAAMLSKAIAVGLPISMLAIDVLMQRNLKTARTWLEKLPFILVSIVVGIVAIKGQAAGKFLGMHNEHSLYDSVVFAAYAYTQYIIRLILPVDLSVVYPYPDRIGIIQYIYLAATFGIVAITIVAWRKNWYILAGGLLFFTANIVLLLQFVQFGEYLMADRYLYISCIGIFIPLVYYLVNWMRQTTKNITAYALFSTIALFYFVATFVRNDIWLSDLNFFRSILDASPNSSVAHYSVGALQMEAGNYKDAEAHFNYAVLLNPRDYKAWYNKGALALHEGKSAESLESLDKCLSLASYPPAFFCRSLLYMSAGKFGAALSDAEQTLAAQPHNARAWYVKAFCTEQQGNPNLAIQLYSKAIAYESTEPLFYKRRGICFANTNQFQPGLADLDKAIFLDGTNAEAFYYRGAIKYNLGGEPCMDLNTAVTKGYKAPPGLIQKLCGTSKE